MSGLTNRRSDRRRRHIGDRRHRPGTGAEPGLTSRACQGSAPALVYLPSTIGNLPCCSLNLSILKPDGSNLSSPSLMGTNGGFVDAKTLPVGGTYTILVDPQGTALGGATLTLYDVPRRRRAQRSSPAALRSSVTTGPVPARMRGSPSQGSPGSASASEASAVTIGSSDLSAL